MPQVKASNSFTDHVNHMQCQRKLSEKLLILDFQPGGFDINIYWSFTEMSNSFDKPICDCNNMTLPNLATLHGTPAIVSNLMCM